MHVMNYETARGSDVDEESTDKGCPQWSSYFLTSRQKRMFVTENASEV